ncbi:pyrroloquinoline quinone biosynthesis protein PqqE [Haloactinomyces albus]|uniref:Pyrroloquinoline quinone biosynthesis protein E n=1 Tax=Haloactinomyces albus TaxID=1352928 RepID=A0AAE3ZJ51_9ACTN|nr:pyrroloquinoline quinone biosynthesis protein PqqE [Haloactinomyces albus]MDR7304579.1 pyrroloquinoline quinone biosynthesis protein E [Haloactinomyces albus]
MHCAYCSNPLNLSDYRDELSTEDWKCVIGEAHELGALQLHLSGGEPLQRRDIVEIVRFGSELGYTPTSSPARSGSRVAVPRNSAGPDWAPCRSACSPTSRSDPFRAEVKELGWPLTVNVVLHRQNVDRIGEIIELTERLRADQVELAITQYYGWAWCNRDAPLPTRAQFERAEPICASSGNACSTWRSSTCCRTTTASTRRPAWAVGAVVAHRRAGRRRPACRTVAASPPGERARASLSWSWRESELFNAFRGTEWISDPCRSSSRRDVDFGGCRCQAFRTTGDATRTDPVCHHSPGRGLVDDVVRAVNETKEAVVGELVSRPHPRNQR